MGVTASSPGWYTHRFAGRDKAGDALPSGVYFYRVTSATGTASRKLLIMR
jgi:hypothetical protein